MSRLALVICSSLALAQSSAMARTEQFECIELVTADADAVLRGTILSIGRVSDDRYYRFSITIRVAETLKGPKVGQVSVAVRTLPPSFDIWLKNKTELLFGLRVLGGDRPPCPFTLRAGQSIIELDGKCKGVFTMDFRWLTARVDILKAAREGVTVVTGAQPVRRLHVSLPPGTGFPRNLDPTFAQNQGVFRRK